MYGLSLIVYFTVIDIIKSFRSPFFILIIFIIYYQYKMEVKSPLKATLVSIVFGIFGGIITSVVLIYLQVSIIPIHFFYIIFISLLLSVKDKRFVCISYGGSILSLFSLIFSYPKIDVYETMIVVAILHMIESLLIFINGGNQFRTDIFYLKGKVQKGIVLNRFWPIPFIVFIGDTMIRPIPLFAILTYADYSLKSSAKDKKRYSSINLLIYSVILLYMSIKKLNIFIVPIFALLGHEFIIFINIYRTNRTKKS